MKLKIAILFTFISISLEAQRFTFSPEIGITCSQIDGDRLQGFDKRGFVFGVNTNYYIYNNFFLGFSGHYMQLGSSRGGNKVVRSVDAVQLTTNFTVASAGFSLNFSPTKNFIIGAGIKHNRLFNFEYKAVVQVFNTEPILFDEDVSSDYLAFELSGQARVIDNIILKASFQRSLSNLYTTDEKSLVEIMLPYYLVYSIAYEFGYDKDKRQKSRKKKRRA